MVTISQAVQDIVNKNIFLQEAVKHNIVSYNKLASNIKAEVQQIVDRKVKTNSIVMALRRHAEKIEGKEKTPTFDYFRETLLKTDICYIIVEESPNALTRIQNLYEQIDFKKGQIFNVIQGNYEVGIITNQDSKDKIMDLLYDEKVLRVVEDLVLISLTYSKVYMFKPGVMYNILRFLAWENINVVSIILTQKELSMLVSREDTMRCYNTLDKLVKHSKSKKNKTKK